MNAGEILLRARSAFKIGDYPLVEKLALRMLEEKPDSAAAYNLLGSVCEKTGRFKKAEEFFLKAVALKPDYVEAHNNLGVILKRVQAYGDAIPHFERAIDLAPGRGDIYYNLANVYKALENEVKAEECYQKAIAVEPGFVPAYNNLGTVLENQGRFGEAIRVYLKGLQVDANQSRLHFNLGVVYDRVGKPAEAKAEFETAARLKPAWPDALNNLGLALLRLGDSAGAEKAIRGLLRSEPRNARALNNLGIILAAQKKSEDALKAYRESSRADPAYAQPLSNAAALLEETGRYSEALEELGKLVTVKPEDSDARLRLGGLYLALDNLREAQVCFKAILEKDPANSRALRSLAAVHQRAGQPDRALEYYRALEKSGSQDQDFRLDLAFLWKDKGENKKAEEEVLKYLAEKPEDTKAKILLSDLHYIQGLSKQAAQGLKEIIQSVPEDQEAYEHLARIYRASGDQKKAIQTMESLINVLESKGASADIDSISRTLEEYEQAIAEHEKDFREERERTIRRLREINAEASKPEKVAAEEDSLMLEEIGPLEEDSVPIINVGGMEPVLSVEEVPEILTVEEKEDLPEETVAIDDERPPNLVNLLQGQELYEENPALQTFQPPPQLPSQSGRGPGGGLPGTGMPTGAPAAPPTQVIQHILQPQGESVLAQSLKESVEAQSRMVDKISRELSDLSCRIDQRPQIVPVTVTMNQPQQAPPPPSYMRPIIVQVPSKEKPSVPPEAYGEGGSLGLPPQGHDPAKEDEKGLPRYAKETAEKAEEPETTLVEVPEKPLKERNAEKAKKSGSDVRKELRDYLNHVKEKLDDTPRANRSPEELLDYLEKLSEYLPERQKRKFRASDERLTMVMLKARLAGRKNLREKITERYRPRVTGKADPITRSVMVDTFSYLKDLSAWHPDKTIGAALKDKIDTLISKVGGVR